MQTGAMHMPEEVARIIQDFARPCTRADWRKGSYLRRTCGYAALYWETRTGFWYDIDHPDEDVRLSIYMYAWTTSRICGINMLLGLSAHAPQRFVEKLFERMTTANLWHLALEAHYFDSYVSLTSSKDNLYDWLFR